jgi:hypothetical protein
MTFDYFINKYNGQYIDYDGHYGYQCVDLVRQYLKEVLAVEPYVAIPPVKYAKNVWEKYNPNYFTRITNGRDNFPGNGDIVIWRYYPGVTGWPGHISVNITGAPMNFISFDQNYKITACHRQLHNYKGVMGWLHKI